MPQGGFDVAGGRQIANLLNDTGRGLPGSVEILREGHPADRTQPTDPRGGEYVDRVGRHSPEKPPGLGVTDSIRDAGGRAGIRLPAQ